MLSADKPPARQLALSKFAHAIEIITGGGGIAVGSYWTFQAIEAGAPASAVASDVIIALSGMGLGYLAIRPRRGRFRTGAPSR